MANCDHSKLDCLGIGLDGRIPQESWLDALCASNIKIREVHPQKQNIEIKKFDKRNSEVNETSRNHALNAGGNLSAKPHESLQLGGKLQVKRDARHSKKSHTVLRTTRVVTMLDDISKDPQNFITRGSKPHIHYTKYECDLSRFILEYIEVEQDKQQVQEVTDSDTGKLVKDLKGNNPVIKLDEYVKSLKARREREVSQRLWEEIANACCAFLDKNKCTHYVYSIELGASSQESEETDNSSKAVSVKATAKAVESVDAKLGGGLQTDTESAIIRSELRGLIDGDVVTVEEVISADLEPVTELINRRSPELKLVMEALLRSYRSGKSLFFQLHLLHSNYG